jgi:hypothetical protein
VSGGAAGGLPRAPGQRRDRLRRERTDAQLRRQVHLEAEAQEQLGPTLGPAGRPMGEAAMALWRRHQADAYLALPPWRRAWRTWVSWGRPHRAAVVLALAAAWTVVCLPLRMLGLASLGASQAGVAAAQAAVDAACGAPVAGAARPLGDGRYAVAVRGGGDATVRLLPVGFGPVPCSAA